jgi:hypothetical protein
LLRKHRMFGSGIVNIVATSAAPESDVKIMAALAVLVSSVIFAALLTSPFENAIELREDKKLK